MRLPDDLRPLVEPLRAFLRERQPAGVGWPHTLGAALLALAAAQFASGLLLALYYAPATSTAWDSVRYIERELPFGSLVRGIHHWGASAFIVLVAAHMAVVFVQGAYKKPRRLLWVVGLLLLFVALGFGYTGYLLPWDDRAYFGTQVGTGIPGSAPLVGPYLLRLLRGGDQIGQLTLARFHAVHVIALPLLMIALTAVHLSLVRRLGVTPPGRPVGSGETEAERQGEPFAPRQLLRDSLAALLVVGVVVLLAWRFPAALGPRADPASTSVVPRPEWYFLGLQHLLRLFPGRLQVLATLVLPKLVLLLLLLVPWLDRSPERRLGARKRVLAAGGLLCAAVIGLTVAGWRSVAREERALARRMAAAVQRGLAAEPAPDPQLVERGREIYRALSCGGCHLEEDPVPNNHAPPLVFEGDRRRRDWLEDYLARPHRIGFERKGRRPIARMPDFQLSGAERAALAHYLSSRRQPERFPARYDPARLPAGAADRGAQLFRERKCVNCHPLDEDRQEQALGPDLRRAARRLRPDFIWTIVENPYRVNPETKMKNLGLSADQVRDLTAYLMTLR